MRHQILVQLLAAAALFYGGFWLGNNGSTAPAVHGAFETTSIAPPSSNAHNAFPATNLRATPTAAPPEKSQALVCSPAASVRPAAPLDAAPSLPSDEDVFVATWCSSAGSDPNGGETQGRLAPLLLVVSSLVDNLPGGSDEGLLSVLLPALSQASSGADGGNAPAYVTREVTILREGGPAAAVAAARGVHIVLPKASQAPAAASLYVQRALGCVLSRMAPDMLLVIGDGTVAAASSLAAAAHGVLVASAGGSASALAQLGQLGRTAAPKAAAALHFPATQFAADSLVQAGACARSVLAVGSLAVDAAVASLAAPPSAAVRHMLVALRLAGDVPDNSDTVVMRASDLASAVRRGHWPGQRALAPLPLPDDAAAGQQTHGQPIVVIVIRNPLAVGLVPAQAPAAGPPSAQAQTPQRAVVGAEAVLAAHVLSVALPDARIVLVLEASERHAASSSSSSSSSTFSAAAAWPADSPDGDATSSATAVTAAVRALIDSGAGVRARAELAGGSLKAAGGALGAGRVRIMQYPASSSSASSASSSSASDAAPSNGENAAMSKGSSVAVDSSTGLSAEQRAWLLSSADVLVTDDAALLPTTVVIGRRAFLLSSLSASPEAEDQPLGETAAEALATGTATLLPARAATVAAHVVAWAAATGRIQPSPAPPAPPAEASEAAAAPNSSPQPAAAAAAEQLPGELPSTVAQATGLQVPDAWSRELTAARAAIAASDSPASRWPVTSYLQSPAMELVARGRLSVHSAFGDGHAALRLAAGLRSLFEGWARLQPAQRGQALRDLLLCRTPQAAAAAAGASQPQMLSLLPPPAADHTLHSPAGFAGRSFSFAPSSASASLGVPSLLDVALGSATPGQRRRHRLECSAQPPTRRAAIASYASLMGMRSAYPGPDAIAPPVTPANDPLDVAPSPLPEGASSRKAAEEDRFAVTAVVAVYRRPQFFMRLLWALGNQTHAPREVWITTFGSKHEDEFRRLIREHDPEARVFRFVAGDPNFKYFGRFALATMAKTPYVALFDDDCLPGRRVIANLLHTVNVEGGDYATLLGMKGHGMETEAAGDTSHGLRPYYAHWVYRPEETTPVDLAGGVWFARTEWLRQMWRETPSPLKLDWRGMGAPYGPWETGEDFQLSYSLRKFLNMPTLLFPSNLTDPETWGASPDYFEISSAGDTTGSSNIAERSNILYANILKGYVPARTDTMWGEAHRLTNVAVLLPSVEQAAALSRVVTFLRAYFHPTVRIWPIVALDPRAPGVSPTMDGAPANVTRDTALAALGMRLEPESRTVGVFDLKLHKAGAGVRWRPADITAEVTSAMAGVLEASRPAALIVPWDDEESPVALAAAMTASSMRIPVLGYADPALSRLRAGLPASPTPEEALATLTVHGQGPALSEAGTGAGAGAVDPTCILVRPPQSIVDAASSQPPPVFGPVPLADASGKPHALCAVRGTFTYAHGPIGFATNSQVLLVRQLFDTLCSCERLSSSGVGTYSRCPDVGSDLKLSEFAGAAVVAVSEYV